MNANNLGQLKIALLVEGLDITEDAKEGVGTKYQEKLYSYSLTDMIDRKVLLPSDLKVGNVFIGFRYNPNSTWRVEADGQRRLLKRKEEMISEVAMVVRPPYYGLLAGDGKPLQSIGVSCGNHGVSFFINSYCEYFSGNEQCKFCGLVPTQKKFSDTVKIKSPEHVSECMAAVLQTNSPVDFIQLSGGSFLNHDNENRQYIPFIKTIRHALVSRGLAGRVPIHLTSMPPLDFGIMHELKVAGLDTISFDLECTTPEYFSKYCPGKTRTTGYDGMRRALRYAKEVFGDGNVFTIVIAGIEPRVDFIRGLGSVMEDGIVPTINIYHSDPFCSPDMDVGSPDVEDLIRLAHDAADLFREKNASPGMLGCAHYDIGHEIKKGYFDVGPKAHMEVF